MRLYEMMGLYMHQKTINQRHSLGRQLLEVSEMLTEVSDSTCESSFRGWRCQVGHQFFFCGVHPPKRWSET